MTALLMTALSAGPALANPSGGQVRAGNVNISTVGPNALHIEQMTQKAIIDWQSFGINPGEAVRFLQPNQLSVILNRVVGQDPSRILGELTANGNVWLINPNGVLFGPGSTVNVGGLVASTLNITNEDFLSGNYRFQQDMSKPLASVVNQGSITITDGGYAVLMAPLVSNEGLIVANLGQVNLLAGESATLNFDGRNLVSYNIGKVEGEAGTVLLSRDAVSDLLANVIKSPTLTEAGGMVENADGTISLVGASGTTISEGTITTNGAEGQKAGKIVLDSGRLTVVGPEAVVEATGSGKNSDGGTVLALSEGMLYTASGSQLKARGSDQGGDGGFVETSGKNFIINSIADVGAAAGKAGEWLIDPEFLTIVEGPVGSGGMDIEPPSSAPDPFATAGGGQVNTISTGFLKEIGSGTVTLQADNQITIGDLVSDLVFKDDVNVKFETLTGDLLFVDRTDKVVVGGTGSLTLDIGRDIYLGVVENTGTGKIDITYGTDGAGKIYADSATPRVIGNDLVFRNTSTDLGVYDDPDDTTIDALRIAGVGTGSPNRIELNVGSGRVVDLITANDVNLDITSAGTLTSGDLSATDITINKSGFLVIGDNTSGFTAKEATISATQNILGHATNGLVAEKATVQANNIGSASNSLKTAVGDLTAKGTQSGGFINVATTDTDLKHLTIESNNSVVTVDTQLVATAANVIAYDDDSQANSFTFIESGNRSAQISDITASSVDLQFKGDITDGGGGVITADEISLTSEGNIGTADNAIKVQGAGSGATALSARVTNSDVYIEHNADANANVTYVDNELNAQGGAARFSSLAFEDKGTDDLVVGTIGGAAMMAEVSITAQGSIVDIGNDDTPGPANVNIYADKVRLTSIGGSVGTSTNAIETSAKELSGDSASGVHLANNKALEVFEITTSGASSTISATNGTVSLEADGTLTSTPVTQGSGADTVDTVTINATKTTGDITVAGVNIAGSSPGTANLNITATTGNIVSAAGAGTDITAQNTVINLTALDGNVGTTTDKITIALSGSDNTVSADAKSDVGLDITGTAPTELSVAHDDGAVDVDVVGGGEVTRTGDALTVKGATGLTTIDYTNRTATNTTLADGSIATNNHSNINITTKGDITGAVGTADIVAGDKTVSIVTEGDFTASASSTGTGSLSLESVRGEAKVTNNNGLTLTDNDLSTQSVGGNLEVTNATGATLTIGQLDVNKNAKFNNAHVITNDDVGTTDLKAASLEVITTAAGTSFDLDTSVSSITIDDGLTTSAAGNGTFTIDNDKGLDNVTIDSRGTDKIEITTNSNSTEKLSYGDNDSGPNSILTASNPDIGNLTITEYQNNIVAGDGTGSVNLAHANTTGINLTTTATNATITSDKSSQEGRIVTKESNANLTINAAGNVDVLTDVSNILDITTSDGTITFEDNHSGGPNDIRINTIAGRNVDGKWGPDGAAPTPNWRVLTYKGDETTPDADLFNITNPDNNNTTNVDFETGKGNIVIGQADVGNGGIGGTEPSANLTLRATDQTDAAVGHIYDDEDDDAGAKTVDIIARNATLLAHGNIGANASGDPGGVRRLETEVPETLEARSETGGVYLDSTTQTIDHLIIDVIQQDYDVKFKNKAGEEIIVKYDISSTTEGALTSSGSTVGTDLTLIERSKTTVVDIASDVTSGENDFVRIIAGGGITNNDGDSTITAGFVDLVSEGHIGTATRAIDTKTSELNLDVRGKNKNAYVANEGDLKNLIINVDQDGAAGTGEASVHVTWTDEENGNSDVGLSVVNTLVSSAATINGGTPTTQVNDASVYISNGLLELEGTFGIKPTPESFRRLASYKSDTGGNLKVGTYTAVDTTVPSHSDPTFTGNDAPYLQLTATKNGSLEGSITQAASSDGIDIGGGTVTLIADGDIGTASAGVKVVTNIASGQTNTVNAYTGGGNADGNDIHIEGTGNGHITYNEVYAGADLDGVVPPTYNVIDRPKDTTIPNFEIKEGSVDPAPGKHAGNVTLTSGGSMDVVDIVAGTATVGDGNITLEATNNVRIGRLQADQDTVKVTVTGNGNITELPEADGGQEVSAGKVFANTFDAKINGTGDIGSGPSGTGPLDLVVNSVKADVNNGAISLRNIGQVEWTDVKSGASTADGKDIYLVSEGAAFVKNVVGGGNSDVLIETRSGSDMLVGEVTAEDNTVTLVSTDRIRTDLGGKVTAKDVLLLATSHIGVAAKTTDPTHDGDGKPIMVIAPLQLNADTVAGRSRTGSIYLEEVTAGGSLTVGEVTDTVLGGTTRTAAGLTATGTNQDIHVDVKNGALDVTRTIDAGRNVALRTAGSTNGINIGTGSDTAQVKAGTTVSLEATGAVTDNNAAGTAAVEATNIVVDAGSLTGAVGTGPFEVKAGTMAVETTGHTFVKDLEGNLTIGQLGTILTPSNTITGSTTTNGDICYEVVAGALTVSNVVTAESRSVGLKAATNIVANADVTAETKISAHAVTGGITGSGILQTETTGVGEIVLRAQNTIGASATNGLDISTDKLAARSSGGSVFIDALAFNRSTSGDRDLEIMSVETINCGEAAVEVEGVTSAAGQQIAINVSRGSLTLTDRVGSGTAGEESSVVALRARDEIDLNNATHGGVVARDKISIESVTGGLLQTDPSTNPSLRTTSADTTAVNGGIVIKTRDNIASSVSGGALTISTDRLAAESTHGDVKIIDVDGSLTVTQIALSTGGTVTGVQAGTDPAATIGDVCLEVEEGTLTVNQAVEAQNGKVAVAAEGNITVNSPGSITARDKISISSVDGGLSGQGLLSTTAATTPDHATDPAQRGGIVISTKDSIGTSVNNAVQIRTDKFAAQSTDGNIFVDAVNSPTLTVTQIETEHCDTTLNNEVTGVTSAPGGTISLNVENGALILDHRVGSNADGEESDIVALRANGSININGGSLGGVVANDTISIESVTGSLTGTLGVGQPTLETDGGDVVIRTAGDITIQIDAARLAAESGGNIDMVNTAGDLTVTTLNLLTGPVAGREIAGVDAVGNVELDVVASLHVDADIRSQAANGNVIVTAGDQILDTTQASGAIIGTNVVLDAVDGIGASGAPVQVNATNFAAGTDSGDIWVQDIAGGMTVAENVAGIAAADGVTAPGLIDISVVGGSSSHLNLAADITSTNSNVVLSATGNVVLGDVSGDQNGVVTAGNNITVSAGGNIIDGNDDQPNLIARGGKDPGDIAEGTVSLTSTGGSIGTATNAIEIQAGKLGATATVGSVNVTDTTGDLEVTGVTAGTDVRISVTDTTSGSGNLDITGQIASTGSGLVHLTAVGDIKDSLVAGTAAVSTGGNLVLQANTLSSASTDGAFEIATAGLAGSIASGNVTIKDLTGDLEIVGAAETGVAGVDGLTAGDGDVCLEVVTGSLDVANVIKAEATGHKTSLRAGANINVNADVTADQKISVLAVNGAVTQDTNGLLDTTVADGSGEVVISANNSIGAAGTGALLVDTDKLAARSTNGSVYIDSQTALTIADLDLENCNLDGVNKDVTGVSAANDIRIDTVGKLDIVADITSTNGTAGLRARGGDLTIGTGDDGVVVKANNTVSLEASGNVVDNNGLGNAAVITPGDVVIVATGGTINGGTGNPFGLEASGLAASADGSISIKDLDANGDGLTVKSVTPLIGTTPVNGVTSTTGDVCLEVAAPGTTDPVNPNAGKLLVNQAITASHAANDGKVALNAHSDIVVGAAINADKKISIHSQTGGLTGASTLSTADAAGEIVIRTDKSIGTSETAPLNVRTTRLAAQSKSESVFIQSDQDVIIAELVLEACGLGGDDASRTVNGLQSGDSEKVMVNVTGTDNDLTFENGAGINKGSTNVANLVALKATGDITLNDNAVKAQEKISIESGGTLTSGVTGGPVLQTTDSDSGIVIMTRNDIDLTIDTDKLAAESTHGDVTIKTSDTAGRSLEVTALTLAIPTTGAATVTGIKAGTEVATSEDVCLEVVGGDLTISEVIEAQNGDVRLNASGGIVAGANVTARDKISALAQAGSITGTGVLATTATGGEVALHAQQNIGTSTQRLNVSTDELAARAVTGDVYLAAGKSLTVTDVALEVCGTTPVGLDVDLKGVTANTAGKVVDIAVTSTMSDPSLTVASGITAGANVALSADGNVTLGSTTGTNQGQVVAGSNITVSAGGDIIDGNDDTTPMIRPNLIANSGNGDVTLSAGGSIGTAANAIEIQAGKLGATATVGSVNVTDTTGDLEVTGVTVGTNVRISVTDTDAGEGNLNITGQIASTGSGLVHLTAEGDIKDSVAGAAVVTEAGNVILASTTGSISGGVDGDGNPTAPFEIEASGLQANAEGSISVKDLDTADNGLTINGASESNAGNVCIETAGELRVDQAVTAAETADGKGKVSLHGGTGVVMGAAVTADKKISVLSGGTITNSAAGLLTTNNATIANGGGVVLVADSHIGAPGAGALNVSTDRLAARSDNGSVYIDSNQVLTIADLMLEVCNLPVGVEPQVTGVTAGGADSQVGIRANGNLTIESVVSATGTNNTVSLEATGNVIDENGTDKAAVITPGDVVIVAGGTINGGTNSPFELEASGLAASADGSISIKDLDANGDGLTVKSVTPLIGTTPVNGVTSTTGDVCLEVAAPGSTGDPNAGKLIVNQAITASHAANDGKVALNAHSDIVVGAAINADKKISIHSHTGGLTGASTLSTADAAGEIVIRTDKSIGTSETAPLNVRTTKLAAQSKSESVFIQSDQDVIIAALVLEACGLGGDVASRTVNGLQSGDSEKVMVNVTGTDNDLTFENGAGINNGSTNVANLVALKATGDITLNDNAVKAQEKISIESGGTLTSGVTIGPALETTDTDTSTANGGIVIKAVGDIGSDSAPLVVSTDRLAAQSAGDVYIQETNSGSLTITEIALEYSGGNVGGLIGDEVVALQTAGDLKVATVIRTTATTPDGIVSLDVDGDLTDENATGTAAVITDTLVVNADSVTGAGGTGAFETAIGTLAARATNNITVKDLDATRGLVIGEADLILTDLTDPTVTGVTSTDGNICIDEVHSTLTINQPVTATDGNVGLSAEGDISVNADVTAKDQISVLSHSGGLSGTGGLESDALAIRTESGVGTSGSPLNINASKLAVDSNGEVYIAADGDVLVTVLSLLNCGTGTADSVSGITANNIVSLDVTGSLTLGGPGASGNPAAAITTRGAETTDTVTLWATGNIVDANNPGVAAVLTPGNLIINSSGGSISGGIDINGNPTAPFEIEARGLQANAQGSISVKDLDVVGNGLTINGASGSDDGNICIETVGLLTVSSTVTANETDDDKGKVSLHGGTGVAINAAVTADKKISVLSGDGITGSGTLTTNSATAAERGVVLSAEGNIHGSSATDRLRINTDQLAAESTNGHILLQTTGTDRDLTVTDLVLEVCGVTPKTIEGVTAKENVEIDVLDGNLRVHSDIESKDSRVALRVQGEQSSVNNSIIIGDGTNGQVKANSIVSLEATGSIVDDNGNNKAAVEAGTLIVKGDSLVGPTSGSPAVTGPFEVKIDTLVAETTNDLKVKDLEGDLTLGQTGPTTTLIGNQTIANSGVTSTDGNICIEAADGVLTVAQAVNANDAGTKTAGVGKVALNGKDGIVLNAAVSADEKVSLYSANGGLGGSNRTLTTNTAGGDGEVVIKTANSIGSVSEPIIVTTNLLAAESGGSVYIDSTQDVTIADLVLEVCGLTDSPVTGVKANGQIGINVTNGNLTIGQGGPVDGRVVSVTSTHATNNTVSLEATGNIVDNNGVNNAAVVTDGTLVARSGGSIDLEVEAETLAAHTGGDLKVKDLTGDLTIGSGTTLLGTQTLTTGATSTGGDICIEADAGVLTVTEAVAAAGVATGGKVALSAHDDIVLNNTVTADKKISLYSEIGALSGSNRTLTTNTTGGNGEVVIKTANSIGSATAPIIVSTDLLAADATKTDGSGGSVYIQSNRSVTIADLVLEACGADPGTHVVGVKSNGEVGLAVTGDLTIGQGAPGVGADPVAIIAKDTVSLEADKVEDNNGDDNAAVITSGTLVIGSNTLTGDGNMDSGDPNPPVPPSDAFEVEVGGLAIDIENGDVAVVSLDGDLTITEGTTVLSTMLNPTETVTGVTTPADFYLDVTNGELRVDEDITVTNGDIALAAKGDITLGSAGGEGVLTVTSGGTTVSVESREGAIFDGHDDNDDPVTAVANIVNSGGDVILSSATGIGGVAGSGDPREGEIEIDAKRFAADGGTGDLKLRDFDNDKDGLEVFQGYTLIDEKFVDGITADVDIYLTVDKSDIRVQENIVAGGDVALRTFEGNIILGDLTDPGGVTSGVIVANNVSLVAGKNIIDNNGDSTDDNDGDGYADGVNIVTRPGGSVVLVAGVSEDPLKTEGSIGINTSGNPDAIETDTTYLAAKTEKGSVSIVEQDIISQDGLDVTTVPVLQTGEQIDGIQAELDVCVDVLPVAGGDLVISRDITSNTQNVGLQSQGGDIRIQSGAVVSTTVSTTAVANQVSMVAKGQITSANNPATTSSIISENVVMVAGSGIGNASAIGIEAVNFAASGGTGDVNIVDRDGNGLTIAELDVDVCHPIVPVTTVTGITTGGNVKVDVTGGDLNVNEDITATNGGVALRTQDGDIIIGDDDTATGSDADVIKAGGKVSLEAFDKDGDGNGGNVVDNNGAGNAAVVTPGNVVIVAEKAGGTNNKPFEVEAGGIAAKTTETLKVKDLTGNLKTVNDTTSFGNAVVDGVTSTEGDICLEVVQGDLDIAEQITSLTGDVRVRANGNVTLSGTDSISAKKTLVVSSATGEIRDTNTGDFVGDTVVLVAAKGIGNTGEVSLRANKLAANGGTGDVNVIDMTGDLEIGKYVGALICDGPVANVTGLSGGGRIIVEVPNGSLTFTEGVNTNPGDPTAKSVTLKTKDEIDLKGHPIVAQDKISIESKDGGLIGTTKDGTPDLRTTNTGGNGQVVIKTKDDINVEVATDKLAAQSTGGSVTIKDLTGNLIVTELELEKGGGKVDGVRAEDGVCLEVVEGALEIAEGISSTNGNVKIRANGDVNVTASDDISAKDQLVISSAKGQLVNNGSGDLVGDTVVLVAATGIGNTRDFTLRANTLAANGGTGSVNVVDRDGGLIIGSYTGALICDGPTETITGVTGGGNIGIEVPNGPLVIDNPVTGGGTVAIKTGGDIESNAPVKGGDKISVETGGSIKDGSGNKEPNFEAPEIVIKAGGDIGTKDNNIEINSDKVAATSTGGGVYLTETDGDLNVGTIELEKGGGTVSGVTGKTKVELDVPKGTVTYDNDNPIKAGDAIYIRTRDTLILDGILEAGNRICIDVTNGDILDNNEGTDIRTKDVVMRASGSIGTPENHIDLDVDRVAAEAIRGSVNITEKNGLTITSMEMCNGGGTIPGIKAGTDVNVKVIEGDLTVGYVEGGGKVTLEVDNGDIYDGNGPDLNIKASGDVELLAPKGYVAPDGDELEILSGTGRIVILEITGYRKPPVSIALAPYLFPPGLFAQDNVAMGLNSFYLDVLYGYLTPEEIALIIEELDRYNYLEDEDFLLEKHPHHKGRKRDEDKDKEQGQ